MILKDLLYKYSKEVYPMHMPGHKAGRYKLIDDLYKVDVTEVPETDHLYDADGVLADSLARLADFYGSNKSIYLVNGSTVGILSAIGGLHQQGDEILIARNCHHSVYNAVIMNALHPKYVYPKMTQWGLLGGIDPEEVRKALADNPKIVSFVMTSPTYDGFISDVEKIKEICDRYNVTLIVDEAHGAHLPYSDLLPPSALAAKAGVVIHSAHKTLPVVTGASLLHLNLPQDQEAAVLKMLSRLQTSSPSYIMMAQMDACVQKLGNNDQLWIDYLDNIEALDKVLKKMKKLYAVTHYAAQDEGIIAMDPAKSVVMTRGTVENGCSISQRLRDTYHIQMELDDALHLLGIMTVADSRKALLTYGKALVKLDRKIKKNTGRQQVHRVPRNLVHHCQPYEAESQQSQAIDLALSVGRVAASMITPYPPGIPAVVPGEVISQALVASISRWLEEDMDVLGVTNGQIEVLADVRITSEDEALSH